MQLTRLENLRGARTQSEPSANGTATWDAPALSAPSRPSFDEVYDATFRSVYGTARRLGVKPYALDDVVQEVFVVVFRQLDGYEGRGSVWGWVLGIVLLVVRNHRRTNRRKGAGRATSSVVEDTGRLAAPVNYDPLEQLLWRDASAILDEALKRMAPEKSQVFVACCFQGYSAVEAAARFNVSVNTIYTRLRAARKQIARLVSFASLSFMRHRHADRVPCATVATFASFASPLRS